MVFIPQFFNKQFNGINYFPKKQVGKCIWVYLEYLKYLVLKKKKKKTKLNFFKSSIGREKTNKQTHNKHLFSQVYPHTHPMYALLKYLPHFWSPKI